MGAREEEAGVLPLVLGAMVRQENANEHKHPQITVRILNVVK